MMGNLSLCHYFTNLTSIYVQGRKFYPSFVLSTLLKTHSIKNNVRVLIGSGFCGEVDKFFYPYIYLGFTAMKMGCELCMLCAGVAGMAQYVSWSLGSYSMCQGHWGCAAYARVTGVVHCILG